MKLLLLLLAIAVAWWMFTSRKRKRSAPPQRSDAGGPPRADTTPAPMLACAHCGVHLPKSEAVVDADGRPFCTEAHRLAGPR